MISYSFICFDNVFIGAVVWAFAAYAYAIAFAAYAIEGAYDVFPFTFFHIISHVFI